MKLLRRAYFAPHRVLGCAKGLLQRALSAPSESQLGGSPRYAFVACIEEGPLEKQALRLFESIRRYTGAFRHSDIFALSPRRGFGISKQGRRRLRELRVHYIDKVLNTECPLYGSANRVAAAAYVASMKNHDVLVVLDSDTIFLREPVEFHLPEGIDVALRPVDMQGICSEGTHDPRDAYWMRLCETFKVPYESIPFVQTSVDRKRVKASYNGGLVVARTSSGILQMWSEIFFRSIGEGILPYSSGEPFRAGAGWISPEIVKFWGTNQAALSLAVWGTTKGVYTLPPTYNFPLHYVEKFSSEELRPIAENLVHVHYHWLFDDAERGSNPLFALNGSLSEEQVDWLSAGTA